MEEENTFIWIVVLLIGVGVYFIFANGNDNNNGSSGGSSFTQNCSRLEPSNPYSSGGHYKGFEWGENGKTCGGNSQSFIAGCEEYYQQEERYNKCLNN